MASGTRLFKIASEINIGKDAIIQFLQQKGFEVENKPTSTLTQEMVDAIYDKFKKEKRAAEVQREKVEKHKAARKPNEPKTGKEGKEAVIEKTPLGPEVIIEQAEQAVFEEAVAHEVHESAHESAHPIKEAGPKVGEVIDLKSFGKKSKKEEAKQAPAKQAPAKQAPVKPEPAPEEEPAKPPQEVPAPEQLPEQKPEQKQQPIEAKETPIPEPEKEGKSTLEIDFALEKKEDAVDTESFEAVEESEEELIPGEDVDEEEKRNRKREKRKKKKKKIAEAEPGEAPKLKGLTIVGKIDLEAAKAKKPERPEHKKTRPPRETDEDQIEGVKYKLKSRKSKGPAEAAPAAAPADMADKKISEDKRKRKKKKSIREQIREEDVDKAIRETLAGISDHSSGNRAKMRQKRKAEREEKELRIQEEKDKQSSILQLTEFVTTNDLANMMNAPVSEIIKKCLQIGMMVTINQRLDKETIQLIAVDYGYEVEFLDDKAIQFVDDEEDDDENLMPRAPIVTIMGHVDHGKTSLLDNIRKANVVAGEAGGITQHIGAYQVKTAQGKYITFLDTPGHEAFTAMRARGAQVTDIVVLVVAADDSVMPQTVEAISHAKAAEVPIVVAINKVDKPDSNPDRIKQQLADYGILVEEWGGTNQSAEISAKFGKNIDVLLDKILLEAEILDLKANPERGARGIVIEANMDKGLGPVATIVVQKGTLRMGDPFVSGVAWGRVRNMLDERGHRIESAGPSAPVRVVGFDTLPTAGDSFMVVASDSEAKNIANERNQLKRQQEMRHARHLSLDEISAQIQIGGVKDLNLIIKGDVWGSIEAIGDSLQKLSREEVRVNIIHKGVGAITENDVMLAVASKAVIIGFNVNPNNAARKLAEQEAIDIRLYNIIYDAINEIQLALEGLLAPEIKENITATIEVRRVFRISRLGSIAGCYVTSGKATRSDKIRVLRDGLPVFNGNISSLKRNKDDVREVDTGYECGIQLDGFNDIQEGDVLETYQIVEVKRKFQ